MDHAHALGIKQASTYALDKAGGIECLSIWGKTGDRGANGIDSDAEEISGAAGRNEDDAEGERIAGEHPLHIRIRGP